MLTECNAVGDRCPSRAFCRKSATWGRVCPGIRMILGVRVGWSRLQPRVPTLKESERNVRHRLLAYGQQPTMIHYFGKQARDDNVLFRSFVPFRRAPLGVRHVGFCTCVWSSNEWFPSFKRIISFFFFLVSFLLFGDSVSSRSCNWNKTDLGYLLSWFTYPTRCKALWNTKGSSLRKLLTSLLLYFTWVGGK